MKVLELAIVVMEVVKHQIYNQSVGGVGVVTY